MVSKTWFSRELPVLEAIVEAFDDPARHKMSLDEIQDATGFSAEEVQRALAQLDRAEPRYLNTQRASQVGYPIMVNGITQRALTEAGQWPDPEQWVDRLVEALQRSAKQEPDADKRSKLRQAATVLGGMARDIVVAVASGQITGN